MKKFTILLLSLIAVSNTFAQSYPAIFQIPIDKYKVIDSAHLKVAYSYTYVRDTIKTRQKYQDVHTLLIGSKTSKYFSQGYEDYNIYIKNLSKKGINGIPNPKIDITSYEVYKNYPVGKTTITDLGTPLRGNYMYEDETGRIAWKITGEKTTILSYPCQRATAQFRGRTYEAWFTTQIPISNGPWKFSGLPGLIMKISDSQGYFAFECIGLEQLKKKEPIKFYTLDYTKITRRNLEKLYRRMHDDSAAFYLTIGVVSFEMNPETRKGKEVKNSTHKLPYNPIERE